MSFPVVLLYCTDLDDGTDDIFEDLGTNIGLGSSSGKIITVIIFGLLSLNDKGWCSLQLMAPNVLVSYGGRTHRHRRFI